MSPSTVLLAALLGGLWLFLQLRKRRSVDCRLPPGPPGLPIVGNLHLLGQLPHRSLRDLAQKYGPIMAMRLGQVPAIVVSSPAAAELFLKTHDMACASRPANEVANYFSYGMKGVIFAEYGPYWRNIRRLCTVKLLNAAKIDSFAKVRRREADAMVRSIKEAAAARRVVDVSSTVKEAMENMACQMVIGRSRDDRFKLKETFQLISQLCGKFNIGDFVPCLSPFDFHGITRRAKIASEALDEILDLIIDEHISEASARPSSDKPKEREDFIDVLLSLMNTNIGDSDGIDGTNIKAILLDMLGASMDTSAHSVEWAISELFRHPRVMKKLQEEIKSAVGPHRRQVEEGDLPKLVYLDMVVKETMRLHPVVPLLLHESIEDSTIDGHHIPKKSRIIVNIWAIGRDPAAWPHRPEEFVPERFENSNVDVLGRDFQLLPFGSGRRGCVGMRLGLIFVRLVTAQLVHCFDWELAGNISPSELDMDEVFGLTTYRANHLKATPVCRLES